MSRSFSFVGQATRPAGPGPCSVPGPPFTSGQRIKAMTIPFPTRSPLLEDLVFNEAVDLVAGRTVSVYDGLYRVGKHCSVTVVGTPLGGENWRIQLEFRAFELELVTWSKLRISLLDKAGKRKAVQPLSSGTTIQTVKLELFSLDVFRGGIIAMDPGQQSIEQRPELPPLSLAAAATDVLGDSDTLLARRFWSAELELDFWVLRSGDRIHVVVVTAV